MGTNYNPKITTDGLVLCVDAANTKSYPGSGTTWYDISGRSNNGTFVNAPPYNSSNKGFFTFNGSTQYVTFDTLSTSLTSNFSVCAFAKISSVVSKNALLSLNNGGVNLFLPGNRLTTTYQLYWDGSWRNGNKTDWIVDQWYYFTWTLSVTTLTFYVNGESNGTISVNSFTPSGQVRIGFANGGEYATGSVSGVKVYNKAMSAIEVKENFAALRGRFLI